MVTRSTERRSLNPVLGKSLVVYARKPDESEMRSTSDVSSEIDGVADRRELAATVDAIAEWQLPSGMIPWFPGGHADPWNHVEAAMALALGGRIARGRAGLRVAGRTAAARRRVAPVLPGRPRRAGQARRQRVRLRRHRRVAPLAADRATAASSRRCGRSSSAPSSSCSTCRPPRGEILWARHADGTPWSFALLTGSSSICHSLRCAIALAEHLGHERPDWELSAARLAHVIRHRSPTRSPRSTAGRWTGTTRCSPACSIGDDGRARLPTAFDAFVMDGRGVRCVGDRPWVTVAETCECAAGPPRRRRARAPPSELFGWAQQYRLDGGRYWTGTVYPDEAHFPGDEQSTYTAASVVLAADGLSGTSTASALFVDHDSVLPELLRVGDQDPALDPD